MLGENHYHVPTLPTILNRGLLHLTGEEECILLFGVAEGIFSPRPKNKNLQPLSQLLYLFGDIPESDKLFCFIINSIAHILCKRMLRVSRNVFSIPANVKVCFVARTPLGGGRPTNTLQNILELVAIDPDQSYIA